MAVDPTTTPANDSLVDWAGNTRVEALWGNFPPETDDARVTTPSLDPATGAVESGKLNTALDNHLAVTDAWQGFPGFIPGVGYAVQVPALTGETEAAALTALTDLRLLAVKLADTTADATELNNGKVATQSPAAAADVNEFTKVSYSLYKYTP